MKHLSALLNVLSEIEIGEEISKQIFESYLSEYFQLLTEDNLKITEEDFDHMQQVAYSLGISEEDFEKMMTEESEEEEEDDEYEDEDLSIDDLYVTPEEEKSNLTGYINRWIKPEPHDNRYLY